MTDPLRDRYDAIPYRHGAIPETHPARIGAIARMLGVPAAPPDRCRVLELGCGEGMNLLPLAERFPHSDFTGIDFSEKQIAVGEAARAACGIKNAQLIRADLRDCEPEAGGFDYVIAHGVYSWVAPEVADRLLAVAAAALSPDGIGCVSYNTLPGWGLLSGVRAFMLGEMRCVTSPGEQSAHAQTVLRTLEKCAAAQPGAYAALLREALADMRVKPPELLFHDEFALENHPVTFADFLARAARHDLQYLAEAHFATMPIEHLPAEVRDEFAALKLDFLRAQQFMDVIFQRWMRNSLLCRGTQPAQRKLDARVIADCAVGLRMKIATLPDDLAAGKPLRLEGPSGLILEIAQPGEKAIILHLSQAASERVPFTALIDSAPAADPDALAAVLYRLFALDAVDLVIVGRGDWLRTSASPAPSALMRYQAEAGFTVANRWHEPVRISEEEQSRLADPGADGNLQARAAAGLLV